MSARHTRLVVNPSARNGAAAGMVVGVQDVLRSHGWTVETCVTTSAEHAVELAAEVEPDVLLVALGGDGLLGRVAQGALVSGAAVAPLPAGRGHDFIRTLGAPHEVMAAAAALATAVERRVDVGMAGETAYLGVATVGYDSRANDYANIAPRAVPAALVYAYGGAMALREVQPVEIGLTVDGVAQPFVGWNVAIGNSGRYGAGMRVNPDASIEDGLLDVTVVKELPRWRYPLLLPKLFRGTHVDGHHICASRGREIEVTAPEGWRVYADGDIAGVTPMRFTVRSAALRILAGTA